VLWRGPAFLKRRWRDEIHQYSLETGNEAHPCTFHDDNDDHDCHARFPKVEYLK
jgi:hypothetical protein